ncbi:hypothetical protein HII12_002598 [Brettanomyces bruxellensis]|uniref:Uncharacterized protein n=1 Tax=Dekkera bruxellensis TaxID=5007 RepID=A0A8H6BG41_DEKBR|nr:hypothetical protein HII12_002598 [Brettanomyces bruxellensis]
MKGTTVKEDMSESLSSESLETQSIDSNLSRADLSSLSTSAGEDVGSGRTVEQLDSENTGGAQIGRRRSSLIRTLSNNIVSRTSTLMDAVRDDSAYASAHDKKRPDYGAELYKSQSILPTDIESQRGEKEAPAESASVSGGESAETVSEVSEKEKEELDVPPDGTFGDGQLAFVLC